MILIPLILTTFTHLWNPVGFPDLFYDEGVYLRRAMHVLDGLGPQESPYYYDHPFFGQLFLAGIFKVLNFPHSIGDSSQPPAQSIYTVFLVPRLLMGGLAIVDTALVYGVAQKRYGNNVALVASMLFSVMPMTWILPRVVLDSILLPFLLSSILLALRASSNPIHKYAWILASGICMGLAIFVKIPVFVLIPLLAYLVLDQRNKSGDRRIKLLLVWLLPVLLIPALWPLESVLSGNFNAWTYTVLWQAKRGSRIIGILWITGIFVLQDPLLFVLATLGGVYAIRKRNWFILLWEVPYIIFLGAVGQPNYFHWNPLLPVFCIASALALLEGLPRLLKAIRVSNQKIVFLPLLPW